MNKLRLALSRAKLWLNNWTTAHREQAPRINSGNSRPSPSLFLGVNREGTKFFLHFFAILGGLVPPLSYFWVPKPQIPQISQISDPRICANFHNQASDSRRICANFPQIPQIPQTFQLFSFACFSFFHKLHKLEKQEKTSFFSQPLTICLYDLGVTTPKSYRHIVWGMKLKKQAKSW